MTAGRCVAALAAAALSLAARHPTHTSSAELVQRADSVEVTIRVFADDIAAVGPLRSYLGERFALVDREGDAVALAWDGAEPTGDILTVRLRGRVPGGLSGLRVRHEVLTERFADQVNVVRAAYGRRTTTLIFTRGDGPKALP